MHLRASDDPEARGRDPEFGDVRWEISLPLEDGTQLLLSMGKKSRDMIFGMLIADMAESGEEEPTSQTRG